MWNHRFIIVNIALTQSSIHHYFHLQTVDPGDLTSRHELRKKAIYDFSWYLKNVFPELGVPHEHSLAWGGVSL